MARYEFKGLAAAAAICLLVTLLPLPPAAASADPGAASGEKIEEIIVTAQKREQSIQDIGTSITAFDSASLRQLGLSSVTDIAQQVPGLQFQAFSPTITIFNLRGISQNDFGDHHEAPVAVYADDVYMASMSAVAGGAYDLDRVEVLRGPQGTLFGRNATGGLIHYVSARPSTAGNSGFVHVTGGQYADIETESALNVPLSGTSALRFSLATTKHGGTIRNLAGPDANTQNQYAWRAQWLLKPSDAGEITLKAYGLRNIDEISPSYAWNASCQNQGVIIPGGCPGSYNNLGAFITDTQNPYGTCNGCDQAGYHNPYAFSRPFTQALDRRGVFDRSLYGLTMHVDWSLGALKLASVTDYMHLRKHYGEDSDSTPIYQFNFDTFQKYHQLSQELHLSGGNDAFRWIGGLYYLNMSTDDIQAQQLNQTYLAAVGIFSPAPFFQGNQFVLATKSWATFGQAEWKLAEAWKLIAGLRYTRDSKDYNFQLWNPAPGTPLLDAGGLPYIYNSTTAPGQANRTWGLNSGKIELDYKPARDALIFASINRGPKGGGWSAPSNPAVSNVRSDLFSLLAYKPETLTSYELGTKLTLLDGRARLNADVFYYDYRDYQAFSLRLSTQIIGNSDAKLKGGEIEFTYLPTKGLTTQFGVSVLDTRIIGLPLLSDTVPGASTPVDREMPNAPKLTVNGLVRYEWPATNGTWSAEVNGKWNSRQWLENINAPVDLQPSYAVADLHFGYASDRNWELNAWVKNATNKYYRVYNLDVSFFGYNESVYGNPRWWGATFTYKWANK